MTNKEFMYTLNTATFETVMHTLYFNGKLWIEGNDAKKMSTPSPFDIREWLDKPFDPETEFWKAVIGEIDYPEEKTNVYLCDPDKNTECSKTDCYWSGGQCTMTTHKEFSRAGYYTLGGQLI